MYSCHHSAVAKRVVDTWNGYLLLEASTNVHGLLKVVLSCIVEDERGNFSAEMKRGKLFGDATIIDLTTEDELKDNKNRARSFFYYQFG